MTETVAHIQRSNALDVDLKKVASMRKFYSLLWADQPEEKTIFLNNITKDGPTRVAKINEILALIGTGLLNREEIVNAISKVNEENIQLLLVNNWLTSEKPPDKDSCVAVMQAFAKEKGHLTAEIILTRDKDFTLNSIAKMLIDNSVPMTEDFYLFMEKHLERLTGRTVKK